MALPQKSVGRYTTALIKELNLTLLFSPIDLNLRLGS
jgi:hypothetical protein